MIDVGLEAKAVWMLQIQYILIIWILTEGDAGGI
jgi:hypothetical protein